MKHTPKDLFMKSTSELKTITEVSKDFNMNPNDLIECLIHDRALARVGGRIEPRAWAVVIGYFTLETNEHGQIKNNLLVTDEGAGWILSTYASELRG